MEFRFLNGSSTQETADVEVDSPPPGAPPPPPPAPMPPQTQTSATAPGGGQASTPENNPGATRIHGASVSTPTGPLRLHSEILADPGDFFTRAITELIDNGPAGLTARITAEQDAGPAKTEDLTP